MKRMIGLAAVVLAGAVVRADVRLVDVHVNGLVCDFCARALEKVFAKDEAVASTRIDLDSKILRVELNEGKDLSDRKIRKLVKHAGYSVRKVERGVKEAGDD